VSKIYIIWSIAVVSLRQSAHVFAYIISSSSFSITFFVQHYVLYPQQPEFFFQEVIDADEEDDDESCKSFE